jgi:DsbC/DsbD-like thiol-disulfide interchange protein
MTGINKVGCATALCFLLAVTAQAADDSAWDGDARAGIRLIAGSNSDKAPLRAGIEIKLQPGWKTYWRYPGDSGVPPRFDFTGSDNLKSATVSYPAPHLFSDDSGQTLGYKDDVIFPVTVEPAQAGQPVTLRLKADYAVCEKLCVPAEGRSDLTLGSGTSRNEATLVAAEARVPKLVSAADAGLTVRRLNDAAKPLIAVDLKADHPVQVFVEGPTPEWALPIPTPVQGAPAGRRQFDFALDGLPLGVDPKGHFELTFTVVDGERAIEVKSHLD